MLLKILKKVFEKIEDLHLEKDSKEKMINLMDQILHSIHSNNSDKSQHNSSAFKKKEKKSTFNESQTGTYKAGSIRDSVASEKSEDNMDKSSFNKETLVNMFENKDDIDLGYIYESYYPAHWMMHSTILSIAQLSFLTPDDLFFVQTSVQEEVCPEITVEKLGLLAICFYAISTEYRFLERKEDFIANIGKKIPD